MRKPPLSLFALVTLSQLGATDCGNVLRDPGFDLWCGSELCAWKVTRGDVKEVPTWHESDSGVELLGPDTAIQQLSPVDSSDGTCIEFSLLSAIDRDAVVDLNVDISGDGTIDETQRLPIGDWQQVAIKLVLPAPYAGVRFELAKSGRGHAKLANIGAEISTDCAGLPVIERLPTPLGAPCVYNTDCASGLCGAGATVAPFAGLNGFLSSTTVCIGCDDMHGCATGSVCGIGDGASPVRAVDTTCVPEGNKVLGEACTLDEECETGACSGNVCSTCSFDITCPSGEVCAKAWNAPQTPYVCNPNTHARTSGQPCASHDDCASGVCLGEERSQCNDGRQCSSAAMCPFESGLKNGPCTTVGIQGGVCQ